MNSNRVYVSTCKMVLWNGIADFVMNCQVIKRRVSSANCPTGHGVCPTPLAGLCGEAGLWQFLALKQWSLNLEVLQSHLEILEMQIPGTNTGHLMKEVGGGAQGIWYFPVQMRKVFWWFSYTASAENHYRAGLHNLGWKVRKTTYNLFMV